MDNNAAGPTPPTSHEQNQPAGSCDVSSSSWCSFESVPPPIPFDQGCSIVLSDFKEHNGEVEKPSALFPGNYDEDVFEDANGFETPENLPLVTTSAQSGAGSDNKHKCNVVPTTPPPPVQLDDEDLTSSFHNLTVSKDNSPSNSSEASEARISSTPLCSSSHVPEHTLSDISGPCSSSLVDKVPGFGEGKGEVELRNGIKDAGDGFILNEGATTTTSSSSLSDSTEETEDQRDFYVNSLPSRRGSLKESDSHLPLPSPVEAEVGSDGDVVPMTVDTCEDYWTRLHDVRIHGCILEYAGIGKSLHDNGFAQSNIPLTPLNHYFEITILDPGENCYIAIGLARKDYNVHKNPGWCRGSIAYHADDGKIFIGGGVGTPFGPKCSIHDVLGCGIIFPVKYGELPPGSSWPWEVDDARSTSSSPTKPAKSSLPSRHRRVRQYAYNIDNLGDPSSDSEDDIWWNNRNQVCEDKVKVFFMRNKKLLGIKEVRIPKGGFYPTVGMMSTNERVSVDLHPLTG